MRTKTFNPYSLPIGGSNAPIRCLPTANDIEEEKEEDARPEEEVLFHLFVFFSTTGRLERILFFSSSCDQKL